MKFYQRMPGHNILETILLEKSINPNADVTSWVKGYDGEKEVGKQLKHLPDEYNLYHSIPLGDKGWDMDHLVLSQFGLFILNTKNFPGATVYTDKNELFYDGVKYPDIFNKLQKDVTDLSEKLNVSRDKIHNGLVVLCRDLNVLGSYLDITAKVSDIVKSIEKYNVVVFSEQDLENIKRKIENPETWNLRVSESVSTMKLIEKAQVYIDEAHNVKGTTPVEKQTYKKPKFTQNNYGNRTKKFNYKKKKNDPSRTKTILAVVFILVCIMAFSGKGKTVDTPNQSSITGNTANSPTLINGNDANQNQGKMERPSDDAIVNDLNYMNQPSYKLMPVPELIKSKELCGNIEDCHVGEMSKEGGVVFYDAGTIEPWGRYLVYNNIMPSNSLIDPYLGCTNLNNFKATLLVFKTYKGGNTINERLNNNKFMFENCPLLKNVYGSYVDTKMFDNTWYLVPSLSESDILLKYLSSLKKPNMFNPKFNYFLSSSYGENGFYYTTGRTTPPVWHGSYRVILTKPVNTLQ